MTIKPAQPNGRAVDADTQVQHIVEVLKAYQMRHPRAKIDVRRRNVVSIRIQIIDPDFHGLDRLEREPEAWQILETLPDDVFTNITMLLLVTPEETSQSLASLEFENPLPSLMLS